MFLKRTFARKFAGREQVPVGQFGLRHYADPHKAEIAAFIAITLQELIGYDLTGMTPADRFIEDLHLEDIDSMAAVDILTEVETRFSVKITDTEAAQVQTIHDLVELVASK